MIRRPAILLSIIMVFMLTACGGNSGNNQASPAAANTAVNSGITPEAEIVIKATNYSFDQQEYHLKKGVPVNIVFENESGNHGILVPELKLRLDAKTSSQVIVPEEAGTFEMTCAIMCGSGHSTMSAKVIVE